jgi:Arc/MetJ-type ribon-helix-helix transcriptional regulator
MAAVSDGSSQKRERRRLPGARMRKLSVSVPADVLAFAEEAVAAGRSPSLSGYVTDALAAKAEDDETDDFLALLAEMDREYGPPSAEALDRARRALGG